MTTSTGLESGLRADVDLIAASRTGDAAAFGVLYERHSGAALVVARQYCDSAADAEDVVADSFAAVWSALQRGHGPEEAFRAYLFTVVRRSAAARRTTGRRVSPTDDITVLEAGAAPVPGAEEPALAGLERSLVARAFATLPERWQAVLWHSEVEGLAPAQIAPLLGLTANSTAALAYRAREGLRQAYLREHLQEPLDPACRTIADRLGGFVRGGLGARDTAQVEAHLEGCGQCRSLALELGDVNHGMRGVIAPLVLGAAGAGALQYLLPTAGGLAAGAGSLANGPVHGSGGAGAAGSGAAGSGAAGTGAASTGAAGSGVGAGAAGVGGVAGVGGLAMVAGAGGATGAGAAAPGIVGGILAVLGGMPVAVAAGVVALLVVAGVAAAQLLGGNDEPASAGVTASASATPGDGTSPSEGTEQTSDPSDTASDQPSAEATVPGAAGTTGGGGAASPGGSSSGAPTRAATTAPTTPAVPPPSGPHVVLNDLSGGTELTAGASGQSLAIGVANTGGTAASDLVATVTLPAGVVLDDVVSSSTVTGRFAVHAVAWACGGSADVVRCTLPTLPPGQTTRLAVVVSVDEAYQGEDGEVTWRVSGAAIDAVTRPMQVRVAPAPARLAFGAVPQPVTLVRGRSVTLDLALVNAGGTATSASVPATVDVALPTGVSLASSSAAWACRPGTVDGTLRCTHAALGARASSTLGLDLVVGTEVTGDLTVQLSPAGGRTDAALTVPYTVLSPASLKVTSGLADVPLALGTRVDVPVTVTNSGDLPAGPVTVNLTAPTGATWAAPVSGAGWTCTPPAGDEVTCVRPQLAAGASAGLVVPLDPQVPSESAPGPLVVAVAAPGADVAGTLRVPTHVVLPVLTLGTADPVVELGATSGTVDARITVSPAAAADAVTATFTLPISLTFDTGSAAASAPSCRFTHDDRTATCALGRLAAGAQASVLLPVQVADVAGSGRVSVTASATGAASVVASRTARTSSANLSVRYQDTGDLDVVEVGAPLLTCAPSSTCLTATTKGTTDNNNLTMVPLDAAPPTGARADVPVSSSTSLALGAGRPVQFAGLYWSGNIGPGDTWSRTQSTALIRGPGGEYVPVEATQVITRTDNAGRTYYQAFADVTTLVAQRGGGTWSVADTAVSASRRDANPSYYAGWALVVVVGEPSNAADAKSLTVNDGGAWVGAGTQPTFRFAMTAGATARVGVVAWEGDAAQSGDQLRLDGVALTPLRRDGTPGSPSNAMDSTATGWSDRSSLGVDAHGFVLAKVAGTVGALTATTSGDQYLLGVVTLRTG